VSLSHKDQVRPVKLLLKQRLELRSFFRTSIGPSTAQEQLDFRAMLAAGGVLFYASDRALRQSLGFELVRVKDAFFQYPQPLPRDPLRSGQRAEPSIPVTHQYLPAPGLDQTPALQHVDDVRPPYRR
jgi:hypothetical protein